jgi:hypothetical protein
MGLRSGLHVSEGKIFLSLLGFEPRLSSQQPNHYTDYTIPAQPNLHEKRKMKDSTISYFTYELFFQKSLTNVATATHYHTDFKQS